MVAGLVRAGRDDEAATRAEALPAGPDRERARAAMAGALAMADAPDPRAAELRSAADPSAAAVWAPAFAQAGDFDGLADLVRDANLTDGRRASLLAGLAEAQARSGHVAAAQQTLDQALALSTGTSEGNALALVGARAALGQVDAVADAVDALRAPADRVRGLSRLAAAHAAAGDQAAALSSLRSAAGVAGRSTGDGIPGAVRELTRVAADAGQAAEVGPWIDTLGDPRVRAAAALGLAEGLSAPALRPRMAQALTRPEGAAEPEAAVDVADPVGPDVAAEAQAERGVAAATPVDPAADAAGAELNDTAKQAIDHAMAELPGAAVDVGATPEIVDAAPEIADAAGSAAARLTTPEAVPASPETPAPRADARVDGADPEDTADAPADIQTPAVSVSDAPQQTKSGHTPLAESTDPAATASDAPDPTPPPAATAATALRPGKTSDDASSLHAGAPADIVWGTDGPTDAIDQVVQAAEPTESIVGNAKHADAPVDVAPVDVVHRIDEPTDAINQVVQAAEPTHTTVEDKTPADAAVDTSAADAPDPSATPDTAAIVDADTAPTVIAVPDLRRLADPEHAQFSEPAPAVYDARFTTTRGAFTLRVHRAWAPRAADRFYQLCRSGFYNNNRFFRVVPGFVVQWGIHGFPSVATAWRNATIPDEPVRERNRRGTVSFAAAAVPNTRTTQVFINLTDNAFLDDLGFAPFAQVTQGMDVVEQLFSAYGEAPSQLQRRIQLEGNAFLDANYPNLDGVVEVEITSRSSQTK